jgi:hypothetical protein
MVANGAAAAVVADMQLRQYLSEVEQNTFIKSNISNPMDFWLS